MCITEARVLRGDDVWPVIETPLPYLVSVTASVADPDLVIGETTRVTVEGTLSTGAPADLSDAWVRFVTSDGRGGGRR